MRTVQPGIESVKLLGKDHNIPIVCLSDERNPFHLTEVLRLCQGDPHAISRVGAVSNYVLVLQARHSWILHAELLIGGERTIRRRNQKGFWIGDEMEPIHAACQTKDGSSRAEMRAEQHDVFVRMLHHRSVVDRFYRGGNLGLRKDGVVSVSSDNIGRHDHLFRSISKIVW